MSSPAPAPVLSCEQAVAWVHRQHEQGRTVALANGCFELLHVGHVRYLEAAAAEADVLLVAINDDDAVTALKGPGRPLLPATERAAMVAALRCVRAVTVFPGLTADRLILALGPDVHCKGPDYAGAVPEQASVDAVGARVAIVGDSKDHAVAELIRRVQQRQVPD